jgi:glutamyl-tRNA reductase
MYLYSPNKIKDEVDKIIQYLNAVHKKPIGDQAKILCGREAIRHLFLVASGADSLAIGEYEILSQIRSTIDMFRKMGISGKYLQILFERAIKVGRRVREKTNISKGKVGIYSIAIDEAKKIVGDITNKRIAIVGAGEMGEKFAGMLYNEGAKNVTILNRTVEKAKALALKYNYNYDSLNLEKIGNFDIAFIAISHDFIQIENKWKTLIIDVSIPPLFSGNNVITLKELEKISLVNLKAREEEMKKIEEIVNEGIDEFIYDYKKEIYDEIIGIIMHRIENIRKNEVIRAINELQKLGIRSQDALEIVDLMSKSMIKKIFEPLFSNVKDIVFNGGDSINYINFLVNIFKDGNIPSNKTEKIKEK